MRRWLLISCCVAALLTWASAEVAQGDDADALADLIDRRIDAGLTAEGVKRVPAADDAEFVRRIYLDLHGVVPSAEQAARFLDDDSQRKRDRLIDELLASERFGEHFGDVWRKRLISPQANEQRMQTDRFSAWLADRFNANDGWDRIVTDLLTASGRIDDNPQVTYLIEGRFPLGVTDLTDLTSRYFLGVQLNCAQCHDHPFVAWKQEDYWGMAAFFAQIQMPGRPKKVYELGVKDDSQMTLARLNGGDEIDGFLSRPPTFLGGQEHEPLRGQTHRAALAQWITSRDNPYFARAAVNRMWWHFFGRGIVTPVDDMHSANEPSHPELLELLSQQFADSGFDLKLLCRAITSSRTYQQTSRPGDQADDEARLFARMSIKVLSAEQLYNSLVAILGPPAKTPSVNVRLGARYEFCQSFAGDGEGEPTRFDRGIPHLLRLMNSPQFAGRSITALASRVQSSGQSADDAVEELFLTILSRRPTAAEIEAAADELANGNSPQAVYRDLAWALLMTSEFSLNH
ncbi:MAG TPA: DUF1549 and DUF1553 domain-containing protein [Pirellulaceae bacterium]|nr:DUF1549 and DUF1553 domain-containing protein [Pirellulaceae bacterium]